MKIAYIAHPIGGDVEGNTKRILEIVRTINFEEPDTVPFASYIADLYALDDNTPEERERGMKNSFALLKAGFIDEMRLYGNKISKGMRAEIKLAGALQIPIIPMTEETKNGLSHIAES